MKRALLVGIDAYEGMALGGCVNDVKTLEPLLARHSDDGGSPNF
jgi:hypothetical protein